MQPGFAGLLQPCLFRERNGKAFWANNIRCELLLSFLDLAEFWYQQTCDSGNLFLRGTETSKNVGQFCGLLHICFLAWDSGANREVDIRSLARWSHPDSHTRYTSDVLKRALDFSHEVLEMQAIQLTSWCIRWICEFWKDGRDKQSLRLSLRQRYLEAFKTMHLFVSSACPL